MYHLQNLRISWALCILVFSSTLSSHFWALSAICTWQARCWDLRWQTPCHKQRPFGDWFLPPIYGNTRVFLKGVGLVENRNTKCIFGGFGRGVWGGGGRGGGANNVQVHYTHAGCYARDIFSCTYTNTSCCARDIFSCTHTHTSFYTRDIFSCAYIHTSRVAIYIFFLHLPTYLMLRPIDIFLADTYILHATLQMFFCCT